MKRLFSIFLSAAILIPSAGFACGHSGFYFGGGYEQLFSYTSKTQYMPVIVGTSPKINFGPGFGGYGLVGYDFKGSRWGVQMPFEYARLKLNHQEWVNSISNLVEGVFHAFTWENGLDLRVVGGVGWSYLSEGSYDNYSKSFGVTGGIGPGIAYFFNRKKVTTAVTLEVPIRINYYPGNHLSANGAWVLSVPIRIGLEVGFP